MEDLLRRELGTSILKRVRGGFGSCFETDSGTIFVKQSNEADAITMFEGEVESLKALHEVNMVCLPKPIKVIKTPKGGGMIVVEYLDFGGLSSQAAKLGEKMARIHLHNSERKIKSPKSEQSVHHKTCDYVQQFGFHVPTYCGALPQQNEWMDSWVDFFARKIDWHVGMAEEKYGDREARQAWSQLVVNLPKLFTGLHIQPSLLHGDLWSGNAGQVDNEPAIWDPASFYGHSEYDLAISKMFGGFGRAYFESYHNVIPKQEGFNDRQDLYCMFHYFNHWNIFGGGYKSSTMSLLHQLNKKYST